MTKRCEKGQALMITALTLTVLMLAAGLAIDMGYLRYERRRMQTAADSAAIAGASQLGVVDWLTASQAAFDDAGLNGFGASTGAQLTAKQVVCPDSSLNCVQMQVAEQLPLFFMRILPNTNSVTISTLAVAEKSAQGCIYALGNGGGAITIGYSYHTIVAAPNCSVVDNGTLNIENAISHTLFASTIVDNAYNGNGTVSPTPVTSSSIQGGDPLAYVAAPGGPASCSPPGSAEPYTANKFSYPCGLNINPGNAPTNPLNLSPGLYTIGGSGLTIAGDGLTVTGTGITLYLVGSNAGVSINAGSDGGPTNDFGAVVQLQAPADSSGGGIPGVLLFQDRADTTAGSINLAGFDSGGWQPNSYMWGALYAPSAALTLTGTGYDSADPTYDKCSNTPRFTTVVANQLVFHENVNLSTNDCTWPPVASPVTSVPSPVNDAVLVK